MRYRSIVVSRFGGPEVLDVVEDNLRDARPGEARIKVLVPTNARSPSDAPTSAGAFSSRADSKLASGEPGRQC